MIRAWVWADVLRGLEGTEGLAPLHAFVRRVAASPHAGVLHAYVSMHSVGIARTPDIQDGQERLFVATEPKRGRVHMAFTDWGWWDVSGPAALLRGKDAWIRDYAPEEAWPAFLKFLSRVGWVPGADRA